MPTVVGVQDASRPRVALVHDFLLDLRGAERVFLAMCDVWPEADIFTAVYDEEGTEGASRTATCTPRSSSASAHRAHLPGAAAALPRRDRVLRPLRVRPRGVELERLGARGDLRRAHGARLLLPQPVPLRVERPRPHAGQPPRPVTRAVLAACSGAGASGTGSPPSASTATSRTRAPPRRASGPTSGRDSTVVYPPVETSRFAPASRGRPLPGALRADAAQADRRGRASLQPARPAARGLGDGPEARTLRRIAGAQRALHRAPRATPRRRACSPPAARSWSRRSRSSGSPRSRPRPRAARDRRARRRHARDGRGGVTGCFWEGGPDELAAAVRRLRRRRRRPGRPACATPPASTPTCSSEAAARGRERLPPFVRRLRRRRRRRSARHRRAARPPRVARRRRDLAVADLPLADGRLRLRRLRLLRRRPAVRHARRLRRAGRGGPRARHPGGDRLRPEPHARPAPVVRGVARRPRRPEARLVRVARRAPGGGPPNDWQSRSRSGAAWTLDAATGQYYLHSFLPSSPTSTGTTRRSRRRCTTSLRFWLDRGVDGFRIDVVHHFGKDPSWATTPAARRHDEDWPTGTSTYAGSGVADEYGGDRMLVGEVYIFDQHRLVALLRHRRRAPPGAQLPLPPPPWSAAAFRTLIANSRRWLRRARGPLVPREPRPPPRRDALRRRRRRRRGPASR